MNNDGEAPCSSRLKPRDGRTDGHVKRCEERCAEENRRLTNSHGAKFNVESVDGKHGDAKGSKLTECLFTSHTKSHELTIHFGTHSRLLPHLGRHSLALSFGHFERPRINETTLFRFLQRQQRSLSHQSPSTFP